jgi:predicted transcriptional regulator
MSGGTVVYTLLQSGLVRGSAWAVTLLLVAGVATQRPRRTELQIVAELLRIASEDGATKTALVYRANLNFKVVQRYLDNLESRGMIKRHEEGLGTFYASTPKGREALSSINKALDCISERGSTKVERLALWP